MPVMALGDALAVVARILVANGTGQANAASVARALIAAEADGQVGHGLSRLPSYAAQSRSGKVDGHAAPVASRPAPGVLAIDAAYGFAYPALDLAVEALPGLARAQGIAAAPIRRSHHCGAMGLVVERLAEAGLVAFMVANTPAAIAPWGGRRALFGTNPIACAFPRPSAAPVVVDMSLSKVARGRILAARARGETIPDDWAVDADGQPTTDPAAALAGTMVPMGDAKGTALALMVEALAAGLTGARFAADASSFLDTEGGPPGTGQLLLAMSPELVGGPDVLAHLGTLFAAVAADAGARLPGSRRLTARARAAAEGIVVPDAVLAMAAG